MSSQNEFLTKAEVAEMLDVSCPTLDKFMKQTSLPYTKIGRKYIFPRDLLNAWIRQRAIARDISKEQEA